GGGWSLNRYVKENPNEADPPWGFVLHDGEYRTARGLAPLARNRWVHLAGVFDGKSETRFYVDGQLQQRTKFTNPVHPSGLPFAIGANPSVQNTFSEYFQGLVDEVRISKSARYDGSFRPQRRFAPDADTLLLFHCDEAQGNSLTDAS